MVINPEKFLATIVNRQKPHSSLLRIKKNKEIKSKKFSILLYLKIDYTPNFEKHMSAISKKANNQFNAVCRATKP